MAAFAERSATGDGATSVGVDDTSRHIEDAGSIQGVPQDGRVIGIVIDTYEVVEDEDALEDGELAHGLARELGENVGLMTLMRLPKRQERDEATAEIDRGIPLLVSVEGFVYL